jgi:hypothetical protein
MIGSVRLMTSGSRIVRLDAESVPVDPDGSFELSTVPGGEWMVQAQASRGPGRRAEFGAAHVTVGDRDPPELMITTSAGATLEGRIVVEGEGPRAIAGLNILAIPADVDYRLASPMSSVLINSAGEFFISGLIGGTTLSLRGGGPDWFLKSLSIGGVDATDVPFDFGTQEVTFAGAEIVVSRASASVTGRVVDERGDPVANYSVIVFPVARELWTEGSRYLRLAGLRGARPFRVGGLPPGEFWIAAIEHVAPGITPAEWQDAALLEKLMTAASRFEVAEGETAAVTLRFTTSAGR